MINTILLSSTPQTASKLKQFILDYSSKFSMAVVSTKSGNWFDKIQKNEPQLLFLDIDDQGVKFPFVLGRLESNKLEVILISSNRGYIYDAINYKISGYLLKPLNLDCLKKTIDFAIKRLERCGSKESDSFKKKNDEIIGIPTMYGYEFLTIKNIIRCESYLKCTRVVTDNSDDIISSYNIGQFIKALSKHNFYCPHQSHLINLSKVQRYLKEGTVIMQDNSSIPVSRRKRTEFLSTISHL